MEDDLIPTKRRCASTQKFEIVEAVVQPHQEQ